MRRTLVILTAILASAACDSLRQESPESMQEVAAERRAALDRRIRTGKDVGDDGMLARWNLPDWLNEISGIVELSDGSLVAHGDERARLAILDPRTGIVKSRFALGLGDVTGDFEGITLVGDTLVMLTSDGRLFVFPKGGDGATVPFHVIETGLGKRCELESITYAPDASEFLVGCKRILDGSEKGRFVFYRIPMGNGGSPPRPSVVEIPLGDDEKGKARTFETSDLTRDPRTGHFVALASRERSILEFTMDGELLGITPLPAGKRHEQPEGIAITRDSLLVVSDEAVSGPAAISLYRWPLDATRRVSP